MPDSERAIRFRTIPLLVAPGIRRPRVPLAALAFAATVLGVVRWADPLGEAAGRFHRVTQAGPSLTALAAEPTRAPLGGYPLDAVLLSPLSWLHGSLPAVAGWVWLVAAGATAGWLVAAWWGSEAAGLAGGLAWQLVASVALAEGDTARLAAFALLPLAWGLMLRALERGLPALVGAGLACGALVAVSEEETLPLLLLAAVSAGTALRQLPARQVVSRLAGILAIAAIVALPAFFLRDGALARAPLVSWPLVVAAAVSVVTLRRDAPRVVLPSLAVLAGLGPVPAESATALGLILLACGVVPPIAQRGAAELARRGASLENA